MAIVHTVGQPENDSERKAISYLSECLPSEYHLFHNLELPDAFGWPYEYDIVLVGQYAVYVIEVKGYRGRIEGNAREWEFSNGAIRRSPIPLANKKARVLKSRLSLQSRALRQVWVQALVLLTDEHVQVDLDDDLAHLVLRLDRVRERILDPSWLPPGSLWSILRLRDQILSFLLEKFRPLHRSLEIGEYQVLETIGQRDLYMLLLARHRLLGVPEHFALKVYTTNVYAEPHIRARQEELILRDARALQRLAGHPNIVHADMPFHWEDDKVVLPLHWVEGYSLRGLLDSGKEIAFPAQVDIVRQAARGLQHAHAHGVIHRNLRAENVIVPRQGPIKLVNFDCARVEDLQTIASRVGSRLDERYSAPEIWFDPGMVSPASDLYALGAVFFELLTGQPPCASKREVIQAKGLPRRPSQLAPGLDPKVDDVIARMCAYNVSDRQKNLTEVIADLDAIC